MKLQFYREESNWQKKNNLWQFNMKLSILLIIFFLSSKFAKALSVQG